ncbi:transposase [Cohnella laeviribosi]|uniref:transposase n=1 Tax=Cohnella laeviribosi TaxID=380174 RepID=UPI0003807DDA|nr:transposase [Cohnella laeviribosi]
MFIWDETLTFEQFRRRFQTEDDCVAALYRFRWPDGFRCPRCGHSQAYTIATRRLPLFECRHCRKQTSLIAGTIMEGSRTPLRLWFQAIFLHCRPEEINATQLASILGVTYKTAWLMCHKLRHAMSQRDAALLLGGKVHIVNAIHRRQFTLEWHQQEHPVLIGASVDEDGQFSYLKIKIQPKFIHHHKLKQPEIEPFLLQHVDKKAQFTVFPVSKGSDAKHKLRKMGWLAESWLARLFRGIGRKHLQVYLDHYCYMRNLPAFTRFSRLLNDCAVFPTITYPKLTGSTAAARSRRLHRNATVSSPFAS